MSTKIGTVVQTATTVPSTPIPADAQHVAVPSTTTQGQIDDLSKAIKAIPASAPFAGLAANDTPTIDLTGLGTVDSPFSADVKISAVTGNTTVTNADGLFTPSSSAITELPLITSTTTIPTQTSPKVVLVRASSSTGLVEVVLPLSPNNNQAIYISRNDYNPSFIANIKTQGTDKIGNTTIYPITTGSSIADTYMCIPVSGGWIIN
jgi:hypothetical protein